VAANDEVRQAIDALEREVDTLKEQVSSMKSRAEGGERIGEEDLKITVDRVDRLVQVMRDRQDVGH